MFNHEKLDKEMSLFSRGLGAFGRGAYDRGAYGRGAYDRGAYDRGAHFLDKYTTNTGMSQILKIIW